MWLLGRTGLGSCIVANKVRQKGRARRKPPPRETNFSPYRLRTYRLRASPYRLRTPKPVASQSAGKELRMVLVGDLLPVVYSQATEQKLVFGSFACTAANQTDECQSSW